ncbi:hypothetical protein [Nostoc sp.]|uniref:hypothetical protein n=1 Tax=Nostoc sp. TaxID=1180 RepID=UPI002FF45185
MTICRRVSLLKFNSAFIGFTEPIILQFSTPCNPFNFSDGNHHLLGEKTEFSRFVIINSMVSKQGMKSEVG